jgi:DNA-binding NarL/FixJ family response regulator
VTLKAIASGKRDQEISQELKIAERTVRHYLQNLYAKLKVESRIEAVVKAIRLGLI